MTKGLIKSNFKLIAVLIAIGLLFQGQVVAQEDPYQNYLIYNGAIGIVNISWANDSESLTYQVDYTDLNGASVAGVHGAGTNAWRQYSVVTQQTTESDIWPFQPNLTPTQYANFEITPSSFAFESPNHRYIVYSATGVGEGETPLGIADLQTGQNRIFDFARVDSVDVSSNLLSTFMQGQVYWSADSSAFGMIVMVPSGDIWVYHVSQLSDLNTVVVQELHTTYLSPSNLLGIDATGNRVLFYGTRRGISPLVIWDVSTASYTEIPVNGRVAGATFVGMDGVLFVDEEGLKRFDLADESVTICDSTITSTWGDGGAFFSPDGEYVAVFDYGGGGRDKLYVLPK